MRPVALLTDFGLADPYAGQLRAALARLATGAALLDVSHQVEPFAVDQAAFFLAASAPHFPQSCVFVCVVDPGVGSPRRLLGATAAGQDFLAPDNGLLSLLLSARPEAQVRDLSAAAAGYAASATFHGRDVFAPLAARLACGTSLAALGPELDRAELARPAWSFARADKRGQDARVLHVDRYGNCVLSVREELAPPWTPAWVRMPWGQRRPILAVRTYADLPPGAAGVLAGSQGFLELAANQASAAELLGLRRGDALRLLREDAP